MKKLLATLALCLPLSVAAQTTSTIIQLDNATVADLHDAVQFWAADSTGTPWDKAVLFGRFLEAITESSGSFTIRVLDSASVDTQAELEALLTDATNILDSAEVDTEAELEALLQGSVNVIVATEIDSYSELAALISDLEAGLEGVLDLQDLQGAVTDGQVPNTITIDYADSARAATVADSVRSLFGATTYETYSEGVLDLQDLQGAVTDGQVPDDITVDLAAVASAVAAGNVTGTDAGTDLTADLEEESHVTEHYENQADEIIMENLGTNLPSGQVATGDGLGGLTALDVISEVELSDEAELEAQITDVTDFYTDNDVDFIAPADLADADWGDGSVSGGSFTLDTDVVAVNEIDQTMEPTWTGDHIFDDDGSDGDAIKIVQDGTGAFTTANIMFHHTNSADDYQYRLFTNKDASGTDTGDSRFVLRVQDPTAANYVNLIAYDAGDSLLSFNHAKGGNRDYGDVKINGGDFLVGAGNVTVSGGNINAATGELQEGGDRALNEADDQSVGARITWNDGIGLPFETASLVEGSANADTIRFDWTASSGFVVTLDEDTWLEAPSNLAEGQLALKVCQDGSGGNALVIGAGLDTGYSSLPVLHEGANQCTILYLTSTDGTNITISTDRAEKHYKVEIGAAGADLATTDSSHVAITLPQGITVTNLEAHVLTAPVGAAISIDVQDGGATSILSTALTIDATENWSKDAATPYVFAADHTLDQYSVLWVDVTQVGSGTAGQLLTVDVYYVD